MAYSLLKLFARCLFYYSILPNFVFKTLSFQYINICLDTDYILIDLLQVQLQNMLGSKFVGYFLEEILDWQKKLSTADAVINAWFEVQRAWTHLESIFIGSEDIRSQLPEESKRFEKIDKEFKVLLIIYYLLF